MPRCFEYPSLYLIEDGKQCSDESPSGLRPPPPRFSGLLPVCSSGHPSETPSNLKPTGRHVQLTVLSEDADMAGKVENVSPPYGATVRDAPIPAYNSRRVVRELKLDVERMTLVADK